MTQPFIFVSTYKIKEGQAEKSKHQTSILCWVYSLHGWRKIRRLHLII